MKRQGSTELPRFIVGALATAGASAANAATVQITFTGSSISSTTGGSLVTDFGGDSTNDLMEAHDGLGLRLRDANLFPLVFAVGYVRSSLNYVFVAVGSNQIPSSASLELSKSVRGLVSISFSDANIRSGEWMNGYLEATASVTQPGEQAITVHRLIFDDASTTAPTGVAYTDGAYPAWQVSAVPEPGSNLALLALGAGGLTLRRRLKRAA